MLRKDSQNMDKAALYPGNRFSKVSVINGAEKLLWPYVKDRGFNSFVNDKIKLSLKKTNGLFSLLRNAICFLDLDLNIRHFWARNVIGTFEKRALDNSREISFA